MIFRISSINIAIACQPGGRHEAGVTLAARNFTFTLG